jgi:hypothetical protein
MKSGTRPMPRLLKIRHARADVSAIKVESNRAVEVGAIRSYALFLQPLQHFRSRMSIDVPRPHGNHRKARCTAASSSGMVEVALP